MKFAHLADCHLDGWRQPELNALNLQSFQKTVSICIKEKVDFILIAGDLFDSSYPSIDTLKEAFKEFRRLSEVKIPVFLIAGSHDYSASGKTFLDVLEKSGFCKNVHQYEERNGFIFLQPTICKNVAIYGYPGKKSGLEVDEIERIKLQDSPGLFKILMLHTTIKSAVPNPKIKSVDDSKLPQVNYLALGHLHINYSKNGKVYPGPIFPNNLSELEELKGGSFYIFDNGKIDKREVKIKEVLVINYETNNALNATDELLNVLVKENLNDKIVIIKISGVIEQGKTSDINFGKIETFAKKSGAWVVLKNTSRLQLSEPELQLDTIDTEDIESEVIKKFESTNQSKFNKLISPLIKVLQLEKIDDEKSAIFEERLLNETKKIIGI
ncbi:MAG: exonuclease SbcCD subunit D [Nanoarchaeota archaeon]|nr:exonuclease SbcCD subunit D [Nanoarchaeota archaeon]